MESTGPRTRPTWLSASWGKHSVAEPVVEISGSSFPHQLPGQAASVSEEGGVLIHPTSTIHGYGCRYDMPDPVERIRRLKGRDSGKPMILLAPSASWLDRLCTGVTDEARILADKYWPGGLTLILQASDEFRKQCAWSADTVAIRQCAHPFVMAVMDIYRMPLVSTSLGYSGEPLPDDSLEFTKALYASGGSDLPELAVIDRTLDSGPATASTIVAFERSGLCRLVRDGTIEPERIVRETGVRFQQDS